MHKILIATLLTIANLTSIGAAEATSSQIEKKSEKTYKDPELEYTIQYPNDWEINNEVTGFDIFIMAPKSEDNLSYANLSIISGKLPKDVTLDIYANENIKNLKNDIKNKIHVIDTGKTTISGMDTIWFHYTRDDDQTEIIHYFFVYDDNAFLITEGAAKKAFPRYKDTLDHIAKSFKKKRNISDFR